MVEETGVPMIALYNIMLKKVDWLNENQDVYASIQIEI